MVNLWYAEAGRNEGFPIDDRSALEIFLTPRPQLSAPRDRYVYFPEHAEVPEAQAVAVRGRSFVIGALVDLPAPGAQGVLFSQGSRFGGHALYIKDDRLHYVNSFVGMFEQTIVSTEPVPTGTNLILSASFVKEGTGHRSRRASCPLYHGETKVGEGRIKTQPGGYMIAGEGLAVGRDVGDPVTQDYPGERPVHVHRRHDPAGRRRRERRAVHRPRARGGRHVDAGVAHGDDGRGPAFRPALRRDDGRRHRDDRRAWPRSWSTRPARN